MSLDDQLPTIAHQKKRAFLAAYAETGNVTLSAEAAGITRRAHNQWLQKDRKYREAFDQAKDMAADLLEAEARRRAASGVREPVFYQGVEVGSVLRYSDLLLIFLLKALRPEKFTERAQVEVALSGRGGGPIEVDVRSAVDRELDELARRLDEADALARGVEERRAPSDDEEKVLPGDVTPDGAL